MKNIVILALLGLLGVLLYLSFRAEMRLFVHEQQAYHRLGVTEFDRDFNKFWRPSPTDRERVEAAAKRLHDLQLEMKQQEGKSREVEGKIEDDLRKFLDGERREE